MEYGKRLMLSVMIDDPFASINWYHKGDVLGTCQHTEMVLSTSKSRRFAVLRINPVVNTDAGTYTCVATGGSYKRASISTCNVIVEGKLIYIIILIICVWECVCPPTLSEIVIPKLLKLVGCNLVCERTS